MNYRLTDEEIAKAKLKYLNRVYPLITTETIRRIREVHGEDREVADAQIAKLQSYYASLTPERVKERIAEIFYDLLGGDTDFDREGGYHPCADLSDEKADQILSLVMGNLVEKVKGIENNGKYHLLEGTKKYPYPQYKEKQVWNEAIQAVLRVMNYE